MTDLSVNRLAPSADYTQLDRANVLRQLQAYNAAQASPLTDTSTAQLVGQVLNAIAFGVDLLGYSLDAKIRELYSATAIHAGSQDKIGKPLGYVRPLAEPAIVTLTLTMDPAGTYPTTITVDHQASNGADSDEVFFGPVTETVVAAYPGGGTVNVDFIEGERYTEILLLVSDGAANQRSQFPQDGVIASSLEVYVGAVLWERVTSWSGQTATSQVYVLAYNEEGNVFVVFGDGIFGEIPTNGADITANFYVGGGERGNLPRGTIETIVSMPDAVLSLTNAAKSSGGTPAQTVKAARYAIPATLSTLSRAVSVRDHASLALRIAGVAKAAAKTLGGKLIGVLVAPTGGGEPSITLKNNVVSGLRDSKMVATEISAQGFRFKDLMFSVLVDVSADYKAAAAEAAFRNYFTNVSGTGLFDFDQLNPAGLDDNGELLISATRIQNKIATDLRASGVARAVVTTLSITPVAVPDTANVGSGTVADADIVIRSSPRRRELYLLFVSATQYTVEERIVGYVSALTDTTLTDDAKDFSLEGVTSYAGYHLMPRRDGGASILVDSVAGQTITVSGVASLFTVANVKEEYYLYKPTATHGTVGTILYVMGGAVGITVTAGATAFSAGDKISIDIFPTLGDIRLRSDEYPQLATADFITRTTGGIK